MKRVAIILVNYNGRDYLPDCLSSLGNLDYPKDDYKIIFVDNASTDESLDYAKKSFPGIEYIAHNENSGFAAGNNIGMSRALEENFDYLFLINQDTITDPNVLTKLVKIADADPQIAAIQPRIMLYPEKDKVNSLGNLIHYLGFGYSSGGYQPFDGNMKIREVAYASGAAVLIRKEVLDKIGLFDQDFFMYHEDLDLGWRMRMAGYKIVIDPSAVVYHKYEFSRSLKKYFYMERNRYICILENYKWLTICLITPACLVMELGLFVFSFKSGFWREKIRAYAYFLKWESWRKIFKHRRQKNILRTAKDKEIVRFFTGIISNQEIDNWVLKKIANPVFDLYWRLIRRLIIW